MEYFTTRHNLHFDCDLEVTPRMRTTLVEVELEDYHVKGSGASGNRLTNKNIIKIKARKSDIYPKDENGEGAAVRDPDEPTVEEVKTPEVKEEAKVVEVKEKPKTKAVKKGKKDKSDPLQPDLFAATEEFLKSSAKDTKKKK